MLILAGLLGLSIGSFLNVVIYRLPRGLSFIAGRSFCPQCRKKIAWFDNLPLLSFALLGGRCRYCRKSISWRYPLVELLTAALFILGLVKFVRLDQFAISGVVELLLAWVLFSALIAIFFIDLEQQIIPDEILLPVVLLFLLVKLFVFPPTTNYWLLATFLPALGASVFLFLIWLVTRGRGMGLGDVKLAFLMGLVLGFPGVVIAFYVAFLTGAVVGIILILVRKAKFGQKIAFGPFLTLATLVTYLWGEKILSLLGKFLG